MAEDKNEKKSVKSIVNNSEYWINFTDERLRDCRDLCVDTWNNPTVEKIEELSKFQLVKHQELDEDKIRKLHMVFETCKPGDDLLKDLFEELCKAEKPALKQIQETVIVLNSIYGTNLQNAMTTSANLFHKIQSDNLLGKIKKSDFTVVDKIACVNKKGTDDKENNKIYSFATKFCSFINPSYPIFDRFSSNLLFMFLYRKDDSVRLKDFGDYSYFCAKYKDFLERYGIEKTDYKGTDIFLWIYGKVLEASEDVAFATVSHIEQNTIITS